jgi:hypothetical protein
MEGLALIAICYAILLTGVRRRAAMRTLSSDRTSAAGTSARTATLARSTRQKFAMGSEPGDDPRIAVAARVLLIVSCLECHPYLLQGCGNGGRLATSTKGEHKWPRVPSL